MKLLMIVPPRAGPNTQCGQTISWLDDFCAPYYRFLDAGAAITLASPTLDQVMLPLATEARGSRTAATLRFANDFHAHAVLICTVALSAVSADDFDLVFQCGPSALRWWSPNHETATRTLSGIAWMDKMDERPFDRSFASAAAV